MNDKGTETEMFEIPPCDFCKMEGAPQPRPAVYDGATTYGSWAYMCERHYGKFGMGLGLGRGQRLVKRA